MQASASEGGNHYPTCSFPGGPLWLLQLVPSPSNVTEIAFLKKQKIIFFTESKLSFLFLYHFSSVIFTFAPMLICPRGCEARWLGLMTPHSQGLQATHWGWEGLARQADQAHTCYSRCAAKATQLQVHRRRILNREAGPSSTQGCGLSPWIMLVL